ncbi:MAG: hypothetical protein HQM16_17740 [Deltaproteobacteria bacterium]|nr:hypothetical protein [Deltaproteobacteria bacterium]
MIFTPQKPDQRIYNLAKKITHYAHMPWVTPFFLIIFFLDSFLMFIPADSLLAVSVLFAKDKKKKWYLTAMTGAFLGFLLFLYLTESQFRSITVAFIQDHDPHDLFGHITSHASKYGYFDLSLAVFTVVPSVFCLVGGIIINLNPSIVFAIVCASKAFRVWLVMYLTAKAYGTAVLIKNKIKTRKEQGKHAKDAHL